MFCFVTIWADETVPFKCDYLGESFPGKEPVIFAPGVVSTNADEYRCVISPDGKEIAFTRDGEILLLTKADDTSGWTVPSPAFSPFDSHGAEPCFSLEGRRLYFCSRRDLPGAKESMNAWASDKQNDKWGKPFNFGPPVTDQTVHAFSVSASGNIYCSGITLIRYVNGKYQKAEKLTPPIKGWHPFVAPDESFIIFDARQEQGYASDLFITFRRDDSTWTEPINCGSPINSLEIENNASLSPDGKFMFFTRNSDIYWVDADFIKELRKTAPK